MNFGDALAALKQGERVCRSGWNGKNMWLLLIPSTNYYFYNLKAVGNGVEGATSQLPFIAMKTVNNAMVPWLASQTDVLAEDWELAS